MPTRPGYLHQLLGYFGILDNEGATMPQRALLRFIGFTVTDDPANGATVVSAGTAEESGITLVRDDDGTPMPARGSIQFDGFTLEDDEEGDATIVHAPAAGEGSGNVTGPESSTDNQVVRHDGTSGNVQGSHVVIDDEGNINLANPGAGTAGGLIQNQGLATFSASIGANQNNYSPSNWAESDIFTVTATGAARTITGFVGVTRGAGSQRKFLKNGGSFDLVLAHNSSASTGGNRIRCPGSLDMTLPPNAAIQLLYEGTGLGGFWHVVGGIATGDVIGTTASTDNTVPRYDGTGGKRIQSSSVVIDDDGHINLANAAGPSAGAEIRNQGWNFITTGSLTINLNNYSPTGWANAEVVNVTPSGAGTARTITGFAAVTRGTGSQRKRLQNIGSINLLLPHNSGSSSSANQLACPGAVDYLLPPNTAIDLYYDASISKWVIVGAPIVVSQSVVSPSISANQNNFEPTGWDGADIVRLTADAARSITGFAAPSSTGKRTKRIFNISSVATAEISLQPEHTSSTAANRMLLPVGNGTHPGNSRMPDYVIGVGKYVDIWYDSTSSRWRVLSEGYGLRLLREVLIVASGTHTFRRDADWYEVEAVGCGGGGGGAQQGANAAAGGCGGCGEPYRTGLKAIAATSFAVTLGTPGTAGSASGGDGGDGGDSTVDGATLKGGKGGKGMTNGTAAAIAAGGDGGSTSIAGESGHYGLRLSGTVAVAGGCAGTIFGGGPPANTTPNTGGTLYSSCYGTGGGGALVINNGGAGFAGAEGAQAAARVREYALIGTAPPA